jgi:hypothetical protein
MDEPFVNSQPDFDPSAPAEPQPMHVVDSSEVRMAQAQLYRAAKNSLELHKMLKYVDEIEGWVQAKITIAAENLENVKNYIEYEMVSSTLEENIQEDLFKPRMTKPEDMPQDVQDKRQLMKTLMDSGLNRIEAGKIADVLEKKGLRLC